MQRKIHFTQIYIPAINKGDRPKISITLPNSDENINYVHEKMREIKAVKKEIEVKFFENKILIIASGHKAKDIIKLIQPDIALDSDANEIIDQFLLTIKEYKKAPRGKKKITSNPNMTFTTTTQHKEIASIIAFLYLNKNFFAAEFKNKNEFTEWKKNNKDAEYLMNEINKALKPDEIDKFEKGILSLIDENDNTSLKSLLNNNEVLRATLLKQIDNPAASNAIQAWQQLLDATNRSSL